MSDCLFCKFISGEFKTEIIYEDEDFIIIKDINPMAENHFLAIPKSHYKYLNQMTCEQANTLSKILLKISDLKELLHLETGYRLVINQGDDAGQSVPHLHIHILSGQKMGWNPAG